MPKISIIIPVYNVEKYIRQALDSVINQTLTDIEIICVNDCTPDKSFEIVKEYAAKDSRFILIEQDTNQGQGVARNCALDIAKGDYIMFLDPDDWYELDACEKAYSQITKNNNEIVFFGLYIQKKSGKKYRKRVYNRFKKFISVIENQHINLAEIENIYLPAVWTVVQIYSRDFLNKHNIRYSTERFLEDLQFFIKSWINSKDVSVLNEPLYNYRRTRVKTIDYTKYFEHALSTKEKAYQIICESENKDTYLKQFIPYKINSDIHWLKVFAGSNKNIKKEFYSKIKNEFKSLSLEYSCDILKLSPKYKDFELIIKSNSFEEYLLRKFFKKILKIK